MKRLRQLAWDVWILTKGYWASEERWSARLLLTAVIGLNLGLVGVNVLQNHAKGGVSAAAQDEEGSGDRPFERSAADPPQQPSAGGRGGCPLQSRAPSRGGRGHRALWRRSAGARHRAREVPHPLRQFQAHHPLQQPVPDVTAVVQPGYLVLCAADRLAPIFLRRDPARRTNPDRERI